MARSVSLHTLGNLSPDRNRWLVMRNKILAAVGAGAVWLGGLAVLSQRVADSPTPGLVVGAASIAGAVIWARRQ